MIYIFLYFYILVLSLVSFTSAKYKKIGWIHVPIILILLAAFRYGTGTDFYTYLNIWNGIKAFNFSFDLGYSYLEPGFVILSSLLKVIYPGDFIFFFFYAALTIGLLTNALDRLNLNIVAGLLLYFCLFYFVYTFNGLRQALSMSIFLWSLFYVEEEAPSRYYLANFVGLLFHYSSIVYLCVGVILFLEVSKSQLLILILLLILGGTVAYFTNVFELLIKFVLGTLFKTKLATYFYDYKEPTTIIEFLPRLFLFAWILFCTFKFSTDRLLTGLIVIYTVGFAIQLSLLDYSYLNTRINMLFRITDIIIALVFISKVNRTHNKIFIFLVFLAVYTSYFIVNLLNPDNVYMVRNFL